MSENPLTSIQTKHITHELCKAGVKKASLEKDWVIKEHQRLILFSELTKLSVADGLSVTKAELNARTAIEYKDFVKEMGEIKERLVVARSKYATIDHEIRLRIAKNFHNKKEMTAGNLIP